MRKIAEKMGMSLSNLQYYYKDKDQLLMAAVAYFFNLCELEVGKTWTSLKQKNDLSLEQFIKETLQLLLTDPDTPDQYVLFREIRALSSRNTALENAINQYYENYCNWLVGLLSAFSDQAPAIVTLLMPYSEGYGIIGETLPMKREQTIEMLTKIVLQLK